MPASAANMSPVIFPLAEGEGDRERELRARFAQFWSTATGDPRTVYDTFISATPFAEGVSSEQVETASVRGWWVQPSVAEHDGVLLYLHGGSYIAGSAKAYRGFASQLASRTRRPVFVLDYPLRLFGNRRPSGRAAIGSPFDAAAGA